MSARVVSVAVVQMTSTPDVAANLAAAGRLTRRAAERGAEVVLLPEAYAFIGRDADKQNIVEPLPGGGAILEHAQRLARDLGCHLVLGGFHEQAPAPDKSFNTCVHLGTDGNVEGLYRKIHLFDVDLADGTALTESAHTEAGDEAVVTRTPFGGLGLTVCYDIRFPYLYQRLVDQGAVAVTVPSAFTLMTGKDHWHVLLRARAIECQVYVLAPAQHGRHHGRRTSYGHALIADPWGCVIAECGDGEGIAVADVDPERVAAVRRELPSLAHRRSDLAARWAAEPGQ